MNIINHHITVVMCYTTNFRSGILLRLAPTISGFTIVLWMLDESITEFKLLRFYELEPNK